jgi:hypothetical protein
MRVCVPRHSPFMKIQRSRRPFTDIGSKTQNDLACQYVHSASYVLSTECIEHRDNSHSLLLSHNCNYRTSDHCVTNRTTVSRFRGISLSTSAVRSRECPHPSSPGTRLRGTSVPTRSHKPSRQAITVNISATLRQRLFRRATTRSAATAKRDRDHGSTMQSFAPSIKNVPRISRTHRDLRFQADGWVQSGDDESERQSFGTQRLGQNIPLACERCAVF